MRRSVLVLAILGVLAGCEHDHAPDDADVSGILALTGDATAGATVFNNSCADSSCHGPDGNSGQGPNLSDEVPNHDDEQLALVIKYGAHDMPAQSQLSDQQIADVIAYLNATF